LILLRRVLWRQKQAKARNFRAFLRVYSKGTP
jgi:hypothetical protein